jgi:SAM-dependent methyltransferase
LENNIEVYDEYVDAYRNYTLAKSERKILALLKDRWHKVKMLDIGVGTGRTSYTFASIVNDYIGIDYSKKMIERCKDIIGENEAVRFDFQCATDLSKYYDRKFDFVLFSMNGICSVGHNERVKIISEVYNVMEDDGLFFFSTHSLHAFPCHFPFHIRLPKFSKKQPFHWLYQSIKLYTRRNRINKIYRNVNKKEICNKPWAILTTGDHDFKMQIYYIKPDYQVKQLKEAGFEVVAVYDENGEERNPLSETICEYMYFLCKKDITRVNT